MGRWIVNLSLDLPVIETYKGNTMSAPQKIRLAQILRAKSIVVFAVLLLAALQATTAAHQFDHQPLGDVCSFCMQLDRLDDISAADNATTVLSIGASGYVELTPQLIVVNRPTFSQPRAPPLS